MILGKKLRQLRHQSMWPHVPYNQELGDFAHALEQQGNIAYKEIGNPPSQIIYQYLCDFVAKVADEQFGRERRTIKILDWGGG